MKKILIAFSMLLLLTGCSENSKIEKKIEEYQDILNIELKDSIYVSKFEDDTYIYTKEELTNGSLPYDPLLFPYTQADTILTTIAHDYEVECDKYINNEWCITEDNRSHLRVSLEEGTLTLEQYTYSGEYDLIDYSYISMTVNSNDEVEFEYYLNQSVEEELNNQDATLKQYMKKEFDGSYESFTVNEDYYSIEKLDNEGNLYGFLDLFEKSNPLYTFATQTEKYYFYLEDEALSNLLIESYVDDHLDFAISYNEDDEITLSYNVLSIEGWEKINIKQTEITLYDENDNEIVISEDLLGRNIDDSYSIIINQLTDIAWLTLNLSNINVLRDDLVDLSCVALDYQIQNDKKVDDFVTYINTNYESLLNSNGIAFNKDTNLDTINSSIPELFDLDYVDTVINTYNEFYDN